MCTGTDVSLPDCVLIGGGCIECAQALTSRSLTVCYRMRTRRVCMGTPVHFVHTVRLR